MIKDIQWIDATPPENWQNEFQQVASWFWNNFTYKIFLDTSYAVWQVTIGLSGTSYWRRGHRV